MEIIEEEARKFSNLPVFVLKSKIKWLESHDVVEALPIQSTVEPEEKTEQIESVIAKAEKDLSQEVNGSLEDIEQTIEALHKDKDNLEGFLKMDDNLYSTSSPKDIFQDTNNNVKKDWVPMVDLSKNHRKGTANEDLFKSKYPPLDPEHSFSYKPDTVINIGTDDELAAGEKLPSTSAFSTSQNDKYLKKRVDYYPAVIQIQGSKDGADKDLSNEDGSNAEGDTGSNEKKKKKKKKRKNKTGNFFE